MRELHKHCSTDTMGPFTLQPEMHSAWLSLGWAPVAAFTATVLDQTNRRSLTPSSQIHHLSAVRPDHCSVFQTADDIQWNVSCTPSYFINELNAACIQVLDDLLWKDEKGQLSIRRTLKLFQRQHWGNFWETGWGAYGLFRALRYQIEPTWTASIPGRSSANVPSRTQPGHFCQYKWPQYYTQKVKVWLLPEVDTALLTTLHTKHQLKTGVNLKTGMNQQEPKPSGNKNARRQLAPTSMLPRQRSAAFRASSSSFSFRPRWRL